MPEGICGGAAASNSSLAFFVAGERSDGATNESVSINKSLTSSVISNIMYPEKYLAGVSNVQDKAIFAGGYTNSLSSKATSMAYSYDSSGILLSSSINNYYVYSPVGAMINKHAIFAGGSRLKENSSSSFSVTNVAIAINRSLTATVLDGLSFVRKYMEKSGLSIQNWYALFAGGNISTDDESFSIVDCYDGSFTRTTIESLSIGRQDITAATVGENNKYALFAGGVRDDGNLNKTMIDIVDVYDDNLTKLSTLSLSIAREELGATTTNKIAIFAGGKTSCTPPHWMEGSNIVEAFDESLTRIIIDPLSEESYGLAATTVGDYALFRGGKSSDNYIDKMYVYKVTNEG